MSIIVRFVKNDTYFPVKLIERTWGGGTGDDGTTTVAAICGTFLCGQMLAGSVGSTTIMSSICGGFLCGEQVCKEA